MAASGIVTEAQRNVFNTVRQAFAFSRSFLNKVRREGAIFHSPFPDYYLANMAIGMGDTIAVSPQPLTVAGVSRASFGYTLFNNLEAEGATLLNTKLREDPLYATLRSLPAFVGPSKSRQSQVPVRLIVSPAGGLARLFNAD
jgi:hypothetical protein